MKRLVELIAVLVAVAIFHSCNTSGCMENRSSLLLAGFYGSNGKQVSMRDVQVGGVGAPRDSLLLDGSNAAGQVYLPLRSTTTSVQFYTHYLQEDIEDAGNNDTITIDYTSEPYLTSQECGVVYRYHINKLEYTRHLIDSIALVDPVVDNREMQRMKIYFVTRAE